MKILVLDDEQKNDFLNEINSPSPLYTVLSNGEILFEGKVIQKIVSNNFYTHLSANIFPLEQEGVGYFQCDTLEKALKISSIIRKFFCLNFKY